MKETAIVLVIEIVVVALSHSVQETAEKDSKRAEIIWLAVILSILLTLLGVQDTFCRHAICSNRLHHSSILPSVACSQTLMDWGWKLIKGIYRKEGEQMNTIWSIIGAVFLLLLSLLGIQTKRVGKQKEEGKAAKSGYCKG